MFGSWQSQATGRFPHDGVQRKPSESFQSPNGLGLVVVVVVVVMMTVLGRLLRLLLRLSLRLSFDLSGQFLTRQVADRLGLLPQRLGALMSQTTRVIGFLLGRITTSLRLFVVSLWSRWLCRSLVLSFFHCAEISRVVLYCSVLLWYIWYGATPS